LLLLLSWTMWKMTLVLLLMAEKISEERLHLMRAK